MQKFRNSIIKNLCLVIAMYLFQSSSAFAGKDGTITNWGKNGKIKYRTCSVKLDSGRTVGLNCSRSDVTCEEYPSLKCTYNGSKGVIIEKGSSAPLKRNNRNR